MENKFYVYKHFRLDSGEVFYIGKGQNRRAWSKKRNIYWHNIVKKYGYRIEIVQSNLTEADAYLLEIKLITQFKSLNQCQANLNDGGAGGVNPSLETRQKMRLKKLGNKSTLETRRKQSISLKGKNKNKVMSDSQKTLLSRLKGGKPFNVYKAIKVKYATYIKGEFIGTFEKHSDCVKALNIPQSHLFRCLSKRRPQFHGYIAEYQESI